MIHSAGELRVTDLCSLLELRQTAVTELVKRAQEVGLLERRPSSTDRRVSLLSLTGEGERRLMQAFRALRDDREAVAASLRALARVAASPDSR
jgi:DNA-binding MarR family transcriptional regulator